MQGFVTSLQRGGWSGRGLIATVRHGQVFETQVGPKAFDSKRAAVDWLQRVAAERSLDLTFKREIKSRGPAVLLP